MTLSLFAAAGVPETRDAAPAVVLPKWWPLCKACGRPIERMAWTSDPEPPARMRFRADCHGMTASVVVPRHQAMAGAMLVEVPAKEKKVA